MDDKSALQGFIVGYLLLGESSLGFRVSSSALPGSCPSKMACMEQTTHLELSWMGGNNCLGPESELFDGLRVLHTESRPFVPSGFGFGLKIQELRFGATLYPKTLLVCFCNCLGPGCFMSEICVGHAETRA